MTTQNKVDQAALKKLLKIECDLSHRLKQLS